MSMGSAFPGRNVRQLSGLQKLHTVNPPSIICYNGEYMHGGGGGIMPKILRIFESM